MSQFEKKRIEPKLHKGKRERIHKSGKEKVDISRESGADRKPAKPVDAPSAPGKNLRPAKDPKHLVKSKDRFKPVRAEIDEDEVQKQIKETYARMTEGKGKTKGSKYRRDKRDLVSQKMMEEQEMQEKSSL